MQSLPPVQLELNDGTLYSESGRIEAISGIIDATTGSVTLRAKFPNKERLLISGGTGTVILPHNQEGCVVIPQHATFEVQDKTYVYQIVNGVAKTRIVSVFEINDGKEYVIQSGLMPGDTIIANGIGSVRENARVKIKEFVAPIE